MLIQLPCANSIQAYQSARLETLESQYERYTKDELYETITGVEDSHHDNRHPLLSIFMKPFKKFLRQEE